MSDPDASPVPGPTRSPDELRAMLAKHDALNTALRRANKTALFAALAAAGITHVVVTFDGYGDEGQIGNVEAKAGDATAELPETSVTLVVAQWGMPDAASRDLPIGDAIEHLAYDCLGETHPGWQDGEGAYGEFVFDVAAGSITLDHDARYTASEHYVHEF